MPMDTIEKRNIFIEADNINQVYMELINNYYSEDKEYQSKMATIVIKNIHDTNMPCSVKGEYNKYYEIFLNNELLDKKWNISEPKWYLSYARRIMNERNGVCPWEKAKKALMDDELSRRGVIVTFRDIDDTYSYSPSLLSLQFTINKDRLNMLTVWRSKELYVAFPINVICMNSLMRLMYNELCKKYKHLKIGEYMEVVGALHKYSNISKPQFYGENLQELGLDKVKFLWSILERGKDEIYDGNYEK